MRCERGSTGRMRSGSISPTLGSTSACRASSGPASSPAGRSIRCWTRGLGACGRVGWVGRGAGRARMARRCWPPCMACACSSWRPGRCAPRSTTRLRSPRTGCAGSPDRSGSSGTGAGSRTIVGPGAGRDARRSPSGSARTASPGPTPWMRPRPRLRRARCRCFRPCATCGGGPTHAVTMAGRAGGPAASCRRWARGRSRPPTPRPVAARSGARHEAGRGTRRGMERSGHLGRTSPRPATRLRRTWSRG